MKELTTHQVYQLMYHASGFIGDSGYLTSYYGGWKNNPDNVWMTLDDEVNDCRYEFNEKDQVVEVAGSSIFIKDTYGDVIQITPIFTVDLEQKVQELTF